MIKKNKIFLYFLFLFLILFINIGNVDAASVYAEFELKSDSTKISDDLATFIENYCSVIGGCGRYCVEEKDYYGDMNGTTSCTGGFTKFHGLTNSSGSTLEEAKNKLVIFFNNYSGEIKTPATNFCKSGDLKGSACDAILEITNSSDTGNDNVKSCSFSLQTFGSGGDKEDWATVFLTYGIKEDFLNVIINANGSNNKQPYDDGVIVNGLDRYHFYSISGGKYDTWPAFSKEYLKRWKKNNPDYKCTITPIFCAVKRDSYYYDWYMELDGACDKDLYPDLLGTQVSVDGVNENGVSYDTEDVDINFNFINNGDIDSCEKLIGTELQDLLKKGVNIVKIVVPIILLILGSLDFAQAVFAQSEDGIKKAQGKFIKRLIIAVVIFLIPNALSMLLTIAHSIWDVIPADLCGII